MDIQKAVQLRLINQSNEKNNPSYLIFQKNLVQNPGEMPMAWLVVQNLAVGAVHPFKYSYLMQAQGEDSFGNFPPQLPARPGDAFHMIQTRSGDEFVRRGAATDPANIDIVNSLPEGSINANILRDGKINAQVNNILPGSKASFRFTPTIFIGAVSQITEGQPLNPAIVSEINTEISLVGIASADIVITGGGGQPFEFLLENVVYA